MTLDLTALANELDGMGEALRQKDQERRLLLQKACVRLQEYAGALETLETKVQMTRDRNLHWRGAYPADEEPLNARYPCPSMPSRINIIANDGSQVPVDQHASALYYALNIGYIIYAYGTGQAPLTCTRPSLCYRDEEILVDGGRLVSNAMVNARRTVQEMGNLANLASAYAQKEPPLVLLSDGPLMWVQPGDTPQERRDNLAPYMAHLDRLRATGASLGGYVDRPRSSGVLSLLHLATLETDEITRERLAHNDLAELTDAALFATLLGPGECSTVFIRQSPTNAFYNGKGHEICHFYLNVSDEPDWPCIVRLEIPLWVHMDPVRRDLLHAVAWQQCRVLGDYHYPYPYVLARAHELALISSEERGNLEEMVINVLRRRGVTARPSSKARQKGLTGGGRRRHHL